MTGQHSLSFFPEQYFPDLNSCFNPAHGSLLQWDTPQASNCKGREPWKCLQRALLVAFSADELHLRFGCKQHRAQEEKHDWSGLYKHLHLEVTIEKTSSSMASDLHMLEVSPVRRIRQQDGVHHVPSVWVCSGADCHALAISGKG